MNILLSITIILKVGGIFQLVSSHAIKNPNGSAWEAKNGAGVFERYAVFIHLTLKLMGPLKEIHFCKCCQVPRKLSSLSTLSLFTDTHKHAVVRDGCRREHNF